MVSAQSNIENVNMPEKAYSCTFLDCFNLQGLQYITFLCSIESLTGFCRCKRTIFVEDIKFWRSLLRNHQSDPRNITSSTAHHPTKLKDIVGYSPSYNFPISLFPPTLGAWYFLSSCSRMVKSRQIRSTNACRSMMVNCRTKWDNSPHIKYTILNIIIFMTILLIDQVTKIPQKKLHRGVKMQSKPAPQLLKISYPIPYRKMLFHAYKWNWYQILLQNGKILLYLKSYPLSTTLSPKKRPHSYLLTLKLAYNTVLFFICQLKYSG